MNKNKNPNQITTTLTKIFSNVEKNENIILMKPYVSITTDIK